jgi:hypothetical protein
MLVNWIARAVLLGIGINSYGFADRGSLVVVRCVIDGADMARCYWSALLSRLRVFITIAG